MSFVRIIPIGVVLLISLIASASTSKKDDDDGSSFLKYHRFGFGIGWAKLSYQEERQFQPTLSTDKIPLSKPVFTAKWGYWLFKESLDLLMQGEIMGGTSERIDVQGGLRFHQLWSGPWHTSVTVGSYSIVRFLPQRDLGYSNVYGLYLQPSIGYRWNRATIFPMEILGWVKWGRPYYGGNISLRESEDWAFGLSWRIPVSETPAFPSVFLDEIIFDARYEISKIKFNEARTVDTKMDRFVVSVGYEF